MIRFAHKVTWLRVAVARKTLAALPPPPALKPLDDPEVNTLRIQLMGRMVLILIGAMVLRSPILLVLSPVIVVVSGLAAIMSPLSIAEFRTTIAEEVRREACLSMR